MSEQRSEHDVLVYAYQENAIKPGFLLIHLFNRDFHKKDKYVKILAQKVSCMHELLDIKIQVNPSQI